MSHYIKLANYLYNNAWDSPIVSLTTAGRFPRNWILVYNPVTLLRHKSGQYPRQWIYPL